MQVIYSSFYPSKEKDIYMALENILQSRFFLMLRLFRTEAIMDFFIIFLENLFSVFPVVFFTVWYSEVYFSQIEVGG